MTPRAPSSKKQIDQLGETFPETQIQPRGPLPLYRSHKEVNGALHYCTDGRCRFDPPRDMKTEYGCCCTADTPETAVLENLAGAPMISTAWADSRRISEVTPKVTHKIADLTSPRGVGTWGVGAEIQVGTDRRQTQSWSRAFRKAGFDGVKHRSRRANSNGSACLAFFGRPGEHDDRLQCGDSLMIGVDLLRSIETTYGIRYFPPAPLFD